MQAIQKELGEKDDYQQELADLEDQCKKKRLTKDAREKVLKEIKNSK